LRGATRRQYLESRLQACERNNAANCSLAIINPDKKIALGLP
jgi:hypothetical protein